jgi:hypothetical protein
MKITDKDSFVNVAELKRKLRAWAKYRQMSIQTTNDLLGIIAKLPITIRGQLETTLDEGNQNDMDT